MSSLSVFTQARKATASSTKPLFKGLDNGLSVYFKPETGRIVFQGTGGNPMHAPSFYPRALAQILENAKAIEAWMVQNQAELLK